MKDIEQQIPSDRLDAIRAAYIDKVPLKEIEHLFGLKRWQLAALIRGFRDEVKIARRRPHVSHDIERITLPQRRLSLDGGGWQYGTITLARNSMHVQVLRERGYAEV